MAPIYADHPFSLIPTPNFSLKDSKTTPDVFDELASEMALVHNIVIRGLNSIYLQAPHIKPVDEKSFCRYIACWYTLLHGHHHGEETMFFPAVEEMTGVKGIMDTTLINTMHSTMALSLSEPTPRPWLPTRRSTRAAEWWL